MPGSCETQLTGDLEENARRGPSYATRACRLLAGHATWLYRSRRDVVVSLLGKLLPDHGLRGIAAGLHVVLEMPSHAASAAAVSKAATVGIAVESLSQHAFADYTGPAGLSTPPSATRGRCSATRKPPNHNVSTEPGAVQVGLVVMAWSL